ncbi:arylsulfatase B-like isoform X2 [Dermacentor silvarum]|uniref:arylsulfatase B-like isoform X2 n=1 Tax=Dermacentor silvarum TaxID=543639 RepID=UPI001896A95C|nr:arylsulfatase B-like isoform X2 [Dermacentor silvarum]
MANCGSSRWSRGVPCSLALWQLAAALLASGTAVRGARQPHVVFIVADDVGWNDVPWHNAGLFSPNLARLASEGVILEQYYAQPICTPTRAAILTGRYPYKLGRQGHVLNPLEPTGLTTSVPLLAEELSRLGYSAHALGKWHLGYCSWSYTPTARGFDSFSGFYLGSQDHYSHTATIDIHTGGFDYRANATPDWDARGHYSSKLLADDTIKLLADHAGQERPLFLYLAFQAVHAPLQVPPEYKVPCTKYHNKNRQLLCGMLNALDEAVGRIEKALMHHGYWNNTLLVFTSDNGGQILEGGNNWPLRGNKNTLWEGGTRVPAFVAGPLLKKTGYTNRKVVHAVDWFPTLLSLAGEKGGPENLDGVNQWEVLSEDATQVRQEFVYNIRKRAHLEGAIRNGDYKFILGDGGHPNGWYPEPDFEDLIGKEDSRNMSRALFNVRSDPEERHDLSPSQPELAALLEKRLRTLARRLVPEDNPSNDPRGDPRRWGGVYTPGWCVPRGPLL